MIIERNVAGCKGFDMPINVSVDGMTLTVASGDFEHSSQSISLTEDVELSVSVESFHRWIYGYLVEVIDTGEITCLFDEQALGDARYVFEDGEPYRPIERILMMSVPADATDLSAPEVEVVVVSIVPLEG